MSGSARGKRGGTPSTTTPMAGPWLSPQVVKRKSVPKLLPAKAPSLDHRDVRRVNRLHADHVVAAIDVVHLAAHTRGEVAQQIKRGAADILDGDVALQGRVVLVPLENVAEIADAGSGERLDRPGRDRVHPNVLAAKIDCEVAHACLERRLGDPHHV